LIPIDLVGNNYTLICRGGGVGLLVGGDGGLLIVSKASKRGEFEERDKIGEVICECVRRCQ
jgi:hypothetical protein